MSLLLGYLHFCVRKPRLPESLGQSRGLWFVPRQDPRVEID